MRATQLHTIYLMTLAAILFVGIEVSASTQDWNMEASAGCADTDCMFRGQTVAANSSVAQLQKINIFSADGKDPRQEHDRAAAAVRALMPIAMIENKNAIPVKGGQSAVTKATAFMVSPCFALTNRHAVFGAAIDVDKNADHTVMINIGAGTDGGFKYSIPAKPIRWGKSNADGNDWAFLQLDKCAGRKLGWMDLAVVNASKITDLKVAMAGYPADKSVAKLSYQPSCSLKSVHYSTATYNHDCASRPGASGSPLFAMKNGKPVVVALHVGATTDRDGVLKEYSDIDSNDAVPLDFLNANPDLKLIIETDIKSFGQPNPATSVAVSPTEAATT